jgi:hypothetical protein
LRNEQKAGSASRRTDDHEEVTRRSWRKEARALWGLSSSQFKQQRKGERARRKMQEESVEAAFVMLLKAF